MGTFFNLLMLAAPLLAALPFHFARGRVLHGMAGLVVMAPMIVAAYVALRWALPPIIIASMLGRVWRGMSGVRRKVAARESMPGHGHD